LHHSDYSVQFAAMEVLRALGVSILGQRDPLARGIVGLDSPQFASRALVSLLADSEPILRQAAVEALRRSNDWRVPAHLSACLADSDRWVRLSAAEALTGIRWQPANPFERASYEVARENWNALAEPGLPLTRILVETLECQSPVLRRAAIELLARVGDAEAVPALIREAARPGDSLAALLALETLLASHARRLGTAALAALAALPDPPDDAGTGPVDCSALRQAAQDELERRNPSNAADPHPR
jgi:HEAT repeat protein